MRAEVYEDGDRDLVFVLGWTNKPEYTNIRWLIDHLTDAGYRVHAVEIPRVVSDFDAEYLDPVAAYVADLGEYRFLGHSTGGLIGAFLDEPAPTTRVYLSPWWGFNEGLTGPLLSLLMRIPTRRTIVPAPHPSPPNFSRFEFVPSVWIRTEQIPLTPLDFETESHYTSGRS